MNSLPFRWILAILSALWAGIHLALTHAVLPNATATMIYETFFGFTASLAIIAAVLLIQGVRYSYPLITVFYVIDALLLAETRLGPALFIGKKLPVNGYVEASIALDVVLAVSTLVLWLMDREMKEDTVKVKSQPQRQ